MTRRFLPYTILLVAVLLAAFTPLPAATPSPVERTIRVQASRFAYEPGVVRVNPGDRVTIELTSLDVVHGLAVDGYDVEAQVDPGQTASISFTADRAGSFRMRCSVTCGDMHPFMVGKLQVGPNTLLWRAGILSVLLTAFGVWRWSR
jgi:heme/copper-type cytochrome/quinol oxidase subunit 2